MDTRKLSYFVQIVDSGSITKAAAALHVAQPALSQQVSALENDLKQRLLIRSKQGVEPTAAGHTLYRHAQSILRLVEQARQDVASSGAAPSGRVSIAIAPYSMASSLTPQIISEVGRRYPDIVVHLTEIFGGVLSEAIKNGRLDMALIYEPGKIRGVQFTTMIVEDLHLVVHPDVDINHGKDTITLAEASTVGLFLPEKNHTLRQLIEKGLAEQELPLEAGGRSGIRPLPHPAHPRQPGRHRVAQVGCGCALPGPGLQGAADRGTRHCRARSPSAPRTTSHCPRPRLPCCWWSRKCCISN